ncbi:MAG: class I SAM-dependent methyltransferase [Acidobacteria bacterium]|nr:class I SAM-dependent methyltransferase [Acidobacteriota bacterium]
MRPNAITEELGDLPYMLPEEGEKVFNFIQTHGLQRCLELGFYHGVSSAYIAGAIEQLGRGSLTTIDLEGARNLQPNIGEVLTRVGLGAWVTYYFEPTSYNWRLMKFLEEGLQGTFDFCYIDGGHNWFSTGFAFFLVARLLRPGGWIIFDDLDWTHEGEAVRESPRVQAMPAEERLTPQVRKVYELLVKSDPSFDFCFEEGQWGYARKRK